MDPLLEQMRLTGDMVLPQRCKEEQGVFHRDGGVLHRVPDEDRRRIRRDLLFQSKSLVLRPVFAARKLHETAPVGILPRRDDRVGQQHGIRLPAAVCRLAGAVEHRTGQRQVSARRKAANGDPVRQDAPAFCVLPQQPDGRAELAQRLVIPCPLAHAVGQHSSVIPCRCKLQRHRVGLAGTDVFVPAAGHHQHQRTAQRVRHGRVRAAQIKFQLPSTGKRTHFKLH